MLTALKGLLAQDCRCSGLTVREGNAAAVATPCRGLPAHSPEHQEAFDPCRHVTTRLSGELNVKSDLLERWTCCQSARR